MAKLGHHGVAELCLLATQWGSLGVAAMRPKLGMASTAWASEVVLKVCVLGKQRYWLELGNRFDALVTLAALLASLCVLFDAGTAVWHRRLQCRLARPHIHRGSEPMSP